VRRLIVENVPEFVDWGPLTKDGRPIERKKGDCFRKWVEQIEAHNYIVDWRIVNCADYGDATTRKRFFLKAVRRGCGKIRWPEPTHAEHPDVDLWGRVLKPWRPISECLDYSDVGKSIFNRDKPLVDDTMQRIANGLRKYCNIDLKPFIVKLNRTGSVESVDAPISTIAAGGGHHLLCRPFLIRANRGCFAESVDRPITSIVAHTTHHALCRPIIIDHFNGGKVFDISKPIGTQTSHDRFSVVRTFVIGQQGCSALRPDDQPMPTISTAGAIRKVDAILLDDGRLIDVRIRMLKPSELAAAHSFPKDYILTGNRSDQVKQIGNSVPVRTAAAMCEADFRNVS